jgi:hypothetical protein
VGVNNGLRETGRPGSEEENSLRIWLGRSELEVLGVSLNLGGLLDIIEQLDVQVSRASLTELTRSDLVGQPDGLDTIGSQEGVEMLDVRFAMIKLSGEVGKEARDETSAESRPDGQHVVLMGGEVDDDDGLLVGRRSANGAGTEGGHEGEGSSLDRGLEPRNVVGLYSSGRSDEGERLISVGLSGPCEHVREGPQAR